MLGIGGFATVVGIECTVLRSAGGRDEDLEDYSYRHPWRVGDRAGLPRHTGELQPGNQLVNEVRHADLFLSALDRFARQGNRYAGRV